jgi:hypothetical protein
MATGGMFTEPEAEAWRKRIGELDAFIATVAEYNHGPTAVRKNAFDSALLASIEATDHVSAVSLRIFGASEPLIHELAHVLDTDNQRSFVVIFRDGRLLIASTDQKSFEEICAADRDNE